jgi:hypothetical protein
MNVTSDLKPKRYSQIHMQACMLASQVGPLYPRQLNRAP